MPVIDIQSKEPRYKIIPISTSTHCCFEYTIEDTLAGNTTMCECFEYEPAQRICDALNEAEQRRQNNLKGIV